MSTDTVTAADADADAVGATEPVRLVATGWDDEGRDTARSVLTPTAMNVRALCLTTPNLVVPILFVPGIMGTRLRVKHRAKGAAWFPPENTWDKLVAVLQHLGRSAADRQRLLDPDNTEVDDTGPAHPSPTCRSLLGIAPGKTDAERATWRGWGGLHAHSYSTILSFLETRFGMVFDPATRGEKLDRTWDDMVMSRQEAGKLGAQKPFAPLHSEQLRDAADVLYPVHAVGYNWLQSNKASGEHLAREIERITAYYRGRGKTCEKVVLVTHSMGGLVARACAQLPGMAERILGVLHGVMPAVGAPATYKRMRAGFEGPEQIVLGRNAAECTAIMANAPGALELLPTARYRAMSKEGERHWLRASHTGTSLQGMPEESDTLLGEADPYADIYLNRGEGWWHLVKEALIDPAGREEREKAKREGRDVVEDDNGQSDFKKFAEVMKTAKILHAFIEDKYHPNTYAYYAADPEQPSWNEVHWKSEGPVAGDLRSALLGHDDHNGTIKLALADKQHGFKIQKGQGPGDGTVPAESGAAPTPHVVQIFRHEGEGKGHGSYDHQHSYNAEIAQAVTLYSIVKMVADSDWLKANLKKA